MKTCLRLTIFMCLLLLPTMLTAAARDTVRVTPPCTEGNAFTISIPFKLPPDVDTVWYRWYRKEQIATASAQAAPVRQAMPAGQTELVAEGIATHANRKITYTVPPESAYGANVEFYFDYRLNDDCCEVWTNSPTYIVTFLPPLPPQASEIAGDTVICSGVTLTYSVEYVENVFYEWSVPDDWTITAGQGSHSITVTAGTQSGSISVALSNSGGSGTARTQAVSVKACGDLIEWCDGITSPGTIDNAGCNDITVAGAIEDDACNGITAAGAIEDAACTGITSAGHISP